jgi:hypothetical protein
MCDIFVSEKDMYYSHFTDEEVKPTKHSKDHTSEDHKLVNYIVKTIH